MTALRQRMIEDMRLRNLSRHTIDAYVLAVKQFAEHFQRSPEQSTPQDVRQYLLYLVQEKHASWSRYNLARCALQFLYRYAMTRKTFEPTTFAGAFYTTEGEAQTGGNPVAKIWREHGDKGPKCENNIKLEFAEEVGKAFQWSLNRAEPENLEDSCHLEVKKKVERFDDKFAHKPTMKVDDAKKSVEVNFPYLETGKDEYVASLGFNSAMTYWAEFTTTMFGKSPDLQQVTYTGVLNDQPVLKITTTRQQFDAKLSTVQETIASYSAITFAKLGLHKIDDKGAKKDQEQHKTAVYKAALAYLRKDQVMVSPKLK